MNGEVCLMTLMRHPVTAAAFSCDKHMSARVLDVVGAILAGQNSLLEQLETLHVARSHEN